MDIGQPQQVQQRSAQCLGAGALTGVRKGWGHRPCSSWRKEVLLGVLRAALQHHKVIKNMGPRLSAVMHGGRLRKKGHKLKRDINNTVALHNPAVPQVGQRGCAFSFLGSFSRSTVLTLHVALLWAAGKTKDLLKFPPSLNYPMQQDPVGMTDGRAVITKEPHSGNYPAVVLCMAFVCLLFMKSEVQLGLESYLK